MDGYICFPLFIYFDIGLVANTYSNTHLRGRENMLTWDSTQNVLTVKLLLCNKEDTCHLKIVNRNSMMCFSWFILYSKQHHSNISTCVSLIVSIKIPNLDFTLQLFVILFGRQISSKESLFQMLQDLERCLGDSWLDRYVKPHYLLHIIACCSCQLQLLYIDFLQDNI